LEELDYYGIAVHLVRFRKASIREELQTRYALLASRFLKTPESDNLKDDRQETMYLLDGSLRLSFPPFV
jgi:hypothetical protein